MLSGEMAGLAMILGSLEELTATQNGVYEPVEARGFKKVTVNVDGGQYAQCAEEVAEMLDIDTSQDWDCDDIKNAILTLQTNLQDMQDCAEDVANILGVDTSQDWDCDDVKDKAQEIEDCCDEVIDKIHERDPDYDPTDPTAPTIPEEIGDLFGFTLPIPPVPPVNPTDSDPFEVIGDADVVDENLDVYIRQISKGGTNSQAPPDTDIHSNRVTYPPYVTVNLALRVRYTRNGEEVQTDLFNIGRGIGGTGHEGEYVEMQGYTVDNSGNITAKIHYHLYGWQPGASQMDWYDVYDTQGPYNIPEFVGFGNADHTYKVYNV